MNLREKRKIAGICIACGTQKAEKGRYYCAGCLEKARAASLKRREELKKNGICIECGQRRAEEGKSLCADCTERNAIRMIKHRMRPKKGGTDDDRQERMRLLPGRDIDEPNGE